jgi:hypothetical protein
LVREQQVPRNEFVQHDALGLAPALHPLPNVAGHGRLRPEELTKLSLRATPSSRTSVLPSTTRVSSLAALAPIAKT